MIEKNIVKTIRFKRIEIEAINSFLKENPGLDFSTMARLAIDQFLTDPTLKALNKNKFKNEKSGNKLWN